MHMKTLAAAVLLQTASAFPHIAEQVATAQDDMSDLIAERAPDAYTKFPEWPGKPNHALFDKFDPKEQLVSTSGKHRYIKPGPTDKRGPCAGLNAAANHGYIPRDGIATAKTITQGLNEAFGLAFDLATFLETATRFFDGDPLSGRWSIGTHSDKTNSLGPIGEAAGNQTGICAYGHLKTEGDASITRGDWLAPTKNSNCLSYPEFTQALLNLAKKREGGRLTPRVLAEHQYIRKQHSIRTNPNYFSPAYAGVAFTFGAHMFAFELLANHSAEEPRGFLEPHVFETFFGYTRDKKGNLKYNLGQERIPDNWYRRSLDDQWDLTDVGLSTAQQCVAYPDNCQVGGNTGEVNSFDGVNLGDISGGFVNSVEDLQDPERFMCFLSQNIQAEVPTFVDKIFSGAAYNAILKIMPAAIQNAVAPLGVCPGMPKGRSVLQYGKKFPGAKYRMEGPRTGF